MSQNKALAILAPIAALASTGARFASLTYTAKGTGETARHTVALGVSVENAYKRDIETLSALRPSLSGVKAQACDEMLASLTKSLEVGIGNNPAYTCADVYTGICGGVKVHRESGEVYVYGRTMGKTVIVAGVHKAVNSSAKTLAKKELGKLLDSSKFRQYSLATLHGARMNGETLEFES
jgi:hypothetical protein